MKLDKPIVILGAGPAGLTAAWTLVTQGREVVILEKQDYAGGLSATLKRNGFYYDLGPHSFYDLPREVYEIVNNIDVPLMQLNRKATLILNGISFKNYPKINPVEFLRKLPISLTTRIICDYITACVERLFNSNSLKTLEDWGRRQFGQTFYNLAMAKMQEKTWGCRPSCLSYYLGSHPTSKISFLKLFTKLVGGGDTFASAALYNRFLYPSKGIGEIFNKLSEAIETLGGRIYTHSCPLRFNINNGNIETVVFNKNGEVSEIACSYVISTIPLPSLLELVEGPQLTAHLRKDLQYRALILPYLVIKRERFVQEQVIYFIDPDIKSRRLFEVKNYSESLGQPDKTMIGLEIFCDYADRFWNYTEDDILTLVLEDINKISPIERSEIVDFFIHRFRYAYPKYELSYPTGFEDAFRAISGIENLLSTGRQGLFLFLNMHESMLWGMRASSHLLSSDNGADWFKYVFDTLKLQTSEVLKR